MAVLLCLSGAQVNTPFISMWYAFQHAHMHGMSASVNFVIQLAKCRAPRIDTGDIREVGVLNFRICGSTGTPLRGGGDRFVHSRPAEVVPRCLVAFYMCRVPTDFL